MGTKIQERFEVRAPAAAVWAFLVDPRRVVTCLPGAELTQVVDDRTFDGTVKVKVGPVSVAYRGRVHLDEVDDLIRIRFGSITPFRGKRWYHALTISDSIYKIDSWLRSSYLLYNSCSAIR